MSSSPSGAEPVLPVTKGRVVPSSLLQVGTITKYEMLNYFRSRRFFVLLIIDVIIAGLITALVGYYGVSSIGVTTALQFYSFMWASFIPLVTILAGIFFGGDAISGEFQNKTGYFLVANPLRRSSIYIGKWLGAFIASMIVFVVFAGITVGNATYYFGLSIPYQFVESLLFSILYLMAVLGLTFLFSALFKSSAMSITVTAILFLFVFSILQTVLNSLIGIEPWFVITYGAGIIGNVLADQYPTTQAVRGIGGRERTVYAVSIPAGLAIMLGYFIITAVLGLIVFEKREFT
jgi:ABC-2 type transport system permease protein